MGWVRNRRVIAALTGLAASAVIATGSNEAGAGPKEDVDAAKTSSAAASKIHIRGKWRYGISTAMQAPKFEGVPGLNSPVLSPADKKCVRPGLVKPAINQAALYYPNGRPSDGPYPQQLLRVSAQYPSMPEECSDNYRRINTIKGEMGDPKDRNIFHNMRGKGIWLPFSCVSCQDKEELNDASEYYYQDGPTGHELGSYYYKCTPGPGVTRVRAVVRQRVKQLDTNQILGQKFFKVPITPYDSLQNPQSAAC